MTEHNDLAAYAPDLSIEGVGRIEAALNAAGVKTYYHETDGNTFLDIQLRGLNGESPLALSWRHDGWQVTEYPDGELADAARWQVNAASLEQLAAEVAGIVNGLDEPDGAEWLDDDAADRQLLAAVHRWARTNGWCNSGSGWTNAPTARTATVRVDWVLDDPAIRVWRKSAGGSSWLWGRAREYEAETVRQAVDILVDLGILPDALHRLHSQVATVDELTAENERLNMQVRLERCRADRYQRRAETAGSAQ